MHYYSFHIGDYRAATAHLSNDEDLAYRRLLDWYYDTETPIAESNLDLIARRLRLNPEVLLAVLHDFFIKQNDLWWNPRADAEILKFQEMVDAGKRGAAKRWQYPPDSPPIAPPLPPDSPPTATPIATNNQEPITNNHKPKINTTATATKVAIPMGVSEEIWSDFLALRKTKKLALTATALGGIVREASKANLSLEDALRTCCERGWGSFKAEWMSTPATRTKAAYAPNLAAARAIFGDERTLTHDANTIDEEK